MFVCFLGSLPCNVNNLTVTPAAPDPKNAVVVDGEKPGSPTTLNVGSTNIEIEVTSEDGSNKQVCCLFINIIMTELTL